MGVPETLPLEIPPGVYSDITKVAAGLRWTEADKMRFRYGLPETFGGWTKYFATAFAGVPRTLVSWAQLDGVINQAAGTHRKVELLQNGVKYDITPRRALRTGTLGADPFTTASGDETIIVAHTAHGLAVGDVVWFTDVSEFDDVDLGDYAWEVSNVVDANTYEIEYLIPASGTTAGGGGAAVGFHYTSFGMANDPFSTSNGSDTISVTWAAHGLVPGDSVTFSGAAAFNGVTVNGSWEVHQVSDANTFTFAYTSAATAGGAGGGASCRACANIAAGAPSGASMRIFCLAKWGEDLLLCPSPGGNIYHWDATLGPSARARILPRAPTADWILVGDEDYQVNAYGTNGDKLAQVWSSIADLSEWVATSTNTAGSKRYIGGSKIVGAVASKREILVFTDTNVYSQQLVGGEDIYAFVPQGKASLMGPLAAVEHNGTVYWTGNGQYYRYNGQIEPIPCTLQRTVFKDMNTAEARGFLAGVNAEFNEVCFWHVRSSSGATYNDAYAKYNFMENCWDPGTMNRTAWTDRGIIYKPLGMSSDGYLYQHETGVSADGEPLDAYIILGDVGMINGRGRQVIQYISKISFDEVMEGNIDVYIPHRKYAKRAYSYKGPWRITADVEMIRPRVRNKYWSMEFQTPRIAFLELMTEDGNVLQQEDGGSITTENEQRDRTEDLLTFWRQGRMFVERQENGY